jgi:glycosyltransferase involved in cell wall biosynthesis
VVPMGVDSALLALAEGEVPAAPAADGRRRIVYLGTLARVRRLDFVLRAFARVREQRADVTLYLVGGGEPADVALLEAEARRLGIEEDVVFTGHLPMDAAVEYVRRADVCLSPYYPTPILNSTSPTKLIEYMAFARPVVANEHPEQARVLRESGAGLCVPYREEAFAEAALTLLADPARSRHMGELGRRYVLEHRTYEVIARRVDRDYRGLVAGAPAPTTP